MIRLRATTAFIYGAGLAAFCGTIIADAQAPQSESRRSEQEIQHTVRTAIRVYEDNQIRVAIPSGWTVGDLDRPVERYPTSGPSVPHPGGGLVLTKQGYPLAVAHIAGHASPNGRFGEVFRMPWLPDVADESACVRYLGEYPRPVSNKLIFISLILDIDNEAGLRTCGFPGGGPRRWFAGYFTTAKRVWFFGSEGPDCAEKVYTLTTAAKTPPELPNADDPALQKIIAEAIDIVASIHYKRCPPARESASP